MQGGTPYGTIDCLFLFYDMSVSSVTDIFCTPRWWGIARTAYSHAHRCRDALASDKKSAKSCSPWGQGLISTLDGAAGLAI
jgi:hypothetical protein